jgi:hypothetical protein
VGLTSKAIRLGAAGVLLVVVAACRVTLLDSYNKESEEGLLRAYGKVETLFDDLAEAKPPRPYAPYATRYGDINEQIRVQVLRESARPLNKESYEIIVTIDSVFRRYRKEHRDSNDVNDFLIGRHRDNMRRMFGAALRAERVKQDDN